MEFNLIWQGLALLTAGMALSFLIARYASQFIRKLANSAGQVGRGDPDVTVPIRGPKEVATLGEALEQMRPELRELYLDLEQRVRSRTDELSRAYDRLQAEMAGRERAEAQRRTLEVQARAQSKLATLGQLATGVAHEVNQPLTYINMMIQGLRDDFESKHVDEEAVQRRLTTAIAQVERIDKMVLHLRTFGSNDTLEKTAVSLETVLDNSMLLLGEPLRLSNIAVEFLVEDSLPQVRGIANQLEQVFINLFQNSTDAFQTDQRGAKIGVNMRSIPDQDTVQITFSDNGTGIAPGHLDRIFEPFFTTKEAGKGTGLGLSIAYGILQNHGGTITCESNRNGTTFVITLPAEGV